MFGTGFQPKPEISRHSRPASASFTVLEREKGSRQGTFTSSSMGMNKKLHLSEKLLLINSRLVSGMSCVQPNAALTPLQYPFLCRASNYLALLRALFIVRVLRK